MYLHTLPHLQVRAQATCEPISDERTDVVIGGAGLATGPLRVPLGIKGTGYVVSASLKLALLLFAWVV